MLQKKFGIHFGAMAKPLIEQLKGQGIDVREIDVTLDHIQLDADAIVRLAVRGYIPDGQKRQLHKKLMKRIDEALTP